MKINYFNLLFVACLLVCSCKQKSKFERFDSSFSGEVNLEATIVQHPDTLFADPTKLYFADSLLYLLDPDHQYHMSVYCLKDHTIKRILPKGRAENEFIDICRFQLLNNNRLCFTDDISLNYYEYSILEGNRLHQEYKENLKIKDSRIMNYIKLNKFGLASGIFRKKGRFLVHNAINRRDTLMGDYPKDNVNIDDFIKGMAYQTHFETNTSRDFVVGYCTSGDLVFFSANDSLTKIKQYTPIVPEYKNGSMISVTFTNNSVVGFLDVSITEKYVYCLYSGRSFKQYGADVYLGTTIYKFDLKGNKITKYNLNQAIRCLDVNEKNDLIYGITLVPHANLVLFKINE